MSRLNRTIRRGLAVLALSGTLLGAAVGTASAAEPSPKLGTDGFHIANSSGAILVATNATGGESSFGDKYKAWIPGQTETFEDQEDCLGYDKTGDVTFEAYDIDGHDEGALDLQFGIDDGYVKMTLKGQPQGDPGDRFTYGYTGNSGTPDGPGFYHLGTNDLLDQGNVSWDLPADYALPAGVTTADLVNSVMQATGGANSSYTSTSTTKGYGDPVLLVNNFDASPINPSDPDKSDGSETWSAGWSSQQTNSYGISEHDNVTLFDVVEAGVDASQTVEYTTGQDYSQQITANSYPQQTTQVTAQSPTITSSGRLTAQLKNCSWAFEGAQFTYPDTTTISDPQNYRPIKFVTDIIPGNVTQSVGAGVHVTHVSNNRLPVAQTRATQVRHH